jgi:hypothetical protein
MEPKKVNEILSKVIPIWIERYGMMLDPGKIQAIRNTLLMSPHNDGFMRVAVIGEKETHLVPFEDMILNGLKGSEVKKYPIEENE